MSLAPLIRAENRIYANLGAERYWVEVNKPFIDAAVARGDDIVLATRPTEITLYRNGQLSGFGREVRYLESLGYKYDPVSSMMLKPK